MKKIITILVAVVVLTISVFAQAPQKISYQAVVRNSSNALVVNQSVGMRVSIIQGHTTVVYEETYSPIPQTNENGLVSIQIGSGVPITGIFSNINWSESSFFIKTEIDPSGGTNYTITSLTQMLSVPFALFAQNAGNGFSGAYSDLTGKPALWDSTYASIKNKPTIPAAQIQTDWNATTGIGVLLNKPTLFDGNYNSLTNKPNLFDGTWTSLTGKPILSTVATSGSYNDLNNLPILFSGAYSDLTGKPTIPAAQIQTDWNATTGIGVLLNKPTLATVATSGNYTDLSNKPTIPAAQIQTDWNATTGIGVLLNKPALATVATSGSYTDLSNLPILFSGAYSDLTGKPTIPAAQIQTDWNATTGIGVLLNKPTLFDGNYNSLTNKPNLFDGTWTSLTGKPTFSTVATSGSYNDLNNLPVLFSGAYSDLTGKPTIPAAQIQTDWNATSGIGVLLNKPALATVATSGSYTDLNNTPVIPTQTSQLTNNSGFITNEVQILSISNDTIFLTGGSFVKLPVGFSGNYNDLTNKPTLATVATSGNYNDLTNTPTIDGSETKVTAGTNVTITGSGTTASPYVVNATGTTTSQGVRLGFPSSTTWTCPSGVTQITVQLWGAGGGGGAGANSAAFIGCGNPNSGFFGGSGGSGGSGGYTRQILSVTPGNIYTITIGTGGVGTNTSGVIGTSGGTSSFNNILFAFGGSVGSNGSSGSNTCSNGAQGTNGTVINYVSSEITFTTPSNSSDRNYIPSGYVTSSLTPNCCASGGGGGTGADYDYYGQEYNYSAGNGGTGVAGYCVINY